MAVKLHTVKGKQLRRDEIILSLNKRYHTSARVARVF